MAINRAFTIDNIENKKFIELKLDTQWQDFVGSAEASGVWIIWGESGSGKTTLTMLLAKQLAHHYKVAFNSLEMGTSKALKTVLDAVNMKSVKRNFLILDRENIDDLKERLRKKQAPKVVIIDSLQYADLTKKEYKALKEEFGNKTLFVFISHAEGKQPKGALASFIRYDADVKIRVEGYKGFSTSRFGGGEPYVIWAEEAAKYWVDIE
ncbi:ATP-binding protein [Flavobacterium beibuense]|uniref:ATP-binding protein n=1 Tax=Flavobacterium beibuense TaxID=657326 RepID=UPI003A8FE3FA